MYEVVRAERDTTRPYGYVEPDWRRWVPRYTPGQPWPWWKRDGADGAGAG
jgi:hypothetical protein